VTDALVRERHGNVLLARINRPEARNALDAAVCAGLGEVVVDAEADPDVRAVVLTGTGDRAFCAGMDLKAFAEGRGLAADTPAMAAFHRLMDGDVGVPLVGAANASALAGGLELLLVCDVIVASADARLGLPEVKRGLFPAGTGTALGRRVPLGVALEMTLTGEPVSAARAYELGLVNRVVAPADVVPEALALAEQIAVNAPLGVAACRELVRLYAAGAAHANERRDHWRAVVFGSDDAREGATAFVEKRPPVWRGR
jgi:enoyl-CoA hydratase